MFRAGSALCGIGKRNGKRNRKGCFQLERRRGISYKRLVSRTDQYRVNAATTALLMEAGIDLMRQNLRRQHPAGDPALINALLDAWLHREQDPIPGDTAGSVRIRKQPL